MRALLAVLIAAALLGKASAASSLTLNQPSPVFGQQVNFTATYPKEATRSIGPRQHVNPYVQVDCSQGGVPVARLMAGFLDETRNGDGMITGVSTYITLGPFSGNGMTWTGGGADCSATLYYFGHDLLIHVLAGITFAAGP